MNRIEESISKLKRFKYHAIGRLELEDAIDNVVSWYEQMMKDGNVILTEEDFDAEKEKSMEWGYNLCKEQMLKEAIEATAEICKLADRAWITPTDTKKFGQDVYDHFKAGDKVRIIIVKED